MPWFNDLPEWTANFVGGPYDGCEVVVIAVCDFVAVKRERDPRKPSGRYRMSVIGNPDPTPEGFELYRLEGFDNDTITYVYGDLDTDPPDDTTSAGRTREMEMA